MSYMSPVTAKRLDKLMSQVEVMRFGGSKENQKPHKLLMLLAVVHMADEGGLKENKIYFDSLLERCFEDQFREYALSSDWLQPAPPFFHLRSSGFWHHRIKPGREAEYSRLVTSGGGSKRITENIEYAYLSEDAYAVFTDNAARTKLREFLVALIARNTSNRLKTAFHETFTLSRDAVRQVLAVIADHNQPLLSAKKREELLREHTHLGTRYVKTMPRYAFGVGLLTSDYVLTAFAEAVLQSDQLIDQLDTLWLMHFFLSAPKGPGPLFWHNLICRVMRPGNEVAPNEIEELISRSAEQADGRALAPRSVSDTASIFFGTYTKDDALGRLGILESVPSRKLYRVLDPQPPSAWAFGYALLHFWHTQFGDQVTINLDELYKEDGLGAIFLCGAGRVNRLLSTLQEEGFVDVFRVAPPYQLVLMRSDPQALLQKMYSAHDTF